jgi:methylamine---glutamate N-methyltransferase subunit C
VVVAGDVGHMSGFMAQAGTILVGGDAELSARLDPETGARWATNYLKALTMELTALARVCGKSDVHNLEPEDLAALTVEAAAMAKVPPAGTDWIPGR